MHCKPCFVGTVLAFGRHSFLFFLFVDFWLLFFYLFYLFFTRCSPSFFSEWWSPMVIQAILLLVAFSIFCFLYFHPCLFFLTVLPVWTPRAKCQSEWANTLLRHQVAKLLCLIWRREASVHMKNVGRSHFFQSEVTWLKQISVTSMGHEADEVKH